MTALEESDRHRWATEMKEFLLETKAEAGARTTPPDGFSVTARFAKLAKILDRGWEEAGRPEKLRNSRGRPKATPAQNLLSFRSPRTSFTALPEPLLQNSRTFSPFSSQGRAELLRQLNLRHGDLTDLI